MERLHEATLSDLYVVRTILKKNYKTDTTVLVDLHKVERVINWKLAYLFGGSTDNSIELT